MKPQDESYKIKLVDAPCGSGKTYSTCQYIKSGLKTKNYLYVAQTIRLLEQTQLDLREINVDSKVITSKEFSNVKGKIVTCLDNCNKSGEVLLICLQSYIDLVDFHEKDYRDNWEVIFDEVPQLDDFYALGLHQNPDLLLEFVEVGESDNSLTYPVTVKNRGALMNRLNNPDDVTKQLSPFYKDLLSPFKDVYVDIKSWNQFEDKVIKKHKDSNRVGFLSLLNPKAFNNCTILGAHIQDSLVRDWFDREFSVTFENHADITHGLRYTEHSKETGQRVLVNYIFEDMFHSKRQMKKLVDGKTYTWGEAMDEVVATEYKDKPFLFAVNGDYEGKLTELENATQIPVISHGLNSYSNSVNIYFGAALNREPQHRNMLNSLGFSDKTIKTATLHEATYQALMRTNLRDPNSKEIINCIVPEYETAIELARMLNGAKIRFIGDDRFKKVESFTAAQRKKRSTFNKTNKSVLELSNEICKFVINCLNSGTSNYLPVFEMGVDFEVISLLPRKGNNCLIRIPKEKCTQIDVYHEQSHYLLTKGITQCHGMGCVIRDAKRCCLDQLVITEDDIEIYDVGSFDLQYLIKILHGTSTTHINDEEELFQINPTTFSSNDSGDHRRKTNFEKSKMMVLDFGSGDLSISDFENIFWKEANKSKRSFIICNTFTRNQAHPNRFRVIMFYKSTVKSLETHQAIYDSIVEILESKGFSEHSAQLDRTCRSGNYSFNVPCTNRRNPESAYFKKWGTTTRGIKRYGISPDQYEKTMIQPVSEQAVFETGPSSIVLSSMGQRSIGLPHDEIQDEQERLEPDAGKQPDQRAKYALKSLKEQR